MAHQNTPSELRAKLADMSAPLQVAVMALIDIRDSSAYDEIAKARAAIALERLGIK